MRRYWSYHKHTQIVPSSQHNIVFKLFNVSRSRPHPAHPSMLAWPSKMVTLIYTTLALDVMLSCILQLQRIQSLDQ